MSDADDLRALLRSPALALTPDPDTDRAVRAQAGGIRRQRRGGAVGLVLVLAVGLALGPGLPDRLVPAERRGPAAAAALGAAPEPAAQGLFDVRYAPGAYSSTGTEARLARCAVPVEARTGLAGPADAPRHRVTAAGTPAQVAALLACLQAVPGALVTSEP